MHTPGPWILKIDPFCEKTGNEMHWIWAGKTDADPIGGIVICDAVNEKSKFPVDEQRANNRLIAAAPDLLEAVKKADELLTSAVEVLSRAEWLEYQAIFSAAIAKAEATNA
jgi:hypothetical protein